MRSNFFKYVFIVFVIGIMIFAIYKIRTDEEQKSQMQQVKSEEEEQARIREINLGIAEYDTMNPLTSNNKNVQDIQKLMYEPLVNLTTDYKAEPCLAVEWAKQTETVYIIKLREDARWSDGTSFTSEDVRFTIDILKSPETSSIYTSNVQEVVKVESVDDHTLKIELSQEVPFFEYNLTFPIVEAATYSREEIPGGTGKYKVAENGESIILNKNEYWWGAGKGVNLSLEKININKYESLGEMYNAFKIGNIDLISTDNTNLQEYIGKIGYNEKQLQGREHTFLAFNTQNNFLESTAVRKAIAFSIDKDNIVSSVFNNTCYTSSFPLEFGTWIYQNQNSSSGYNPEQAKQELIDEGWSYRNKGWQRSVSTSSGSRNRSRTTSQRLQINLLVKGSDATKVAVAQNIITQLANQGITVNLVEATDAQYYDNLDSKNYDIAICTINLSPNPSLETFFGENNLANYQKDEVTELMKEVKNTTDENVLRNDYQKLSEFYKNEVPYLSLYANKYSVVYSASMLGELSPNWFTSFYNVDTWAK